MNFYQHHIGDYATATRHLSWEEDLAYRRLIEAYYAHEQPLPLDRKRCYKLAVCQTAKHRAAVDAVLDEFFAKTDQGYRHKRCDDELDAVASKKAKASQSARRRWEEKTHSEGNANASPDASPDAMRTHSEGNAPRARPQTPDTRHHLSSKAARGEASQAPPRASRIPPDWTPGPEGLAFAATLGFAIGRADNAVAKFRDFWSGKAGKDGAKLDWPATWRNWLRRSVEHGAASQRTPAAASDPFAGAL